MRSNGASNLVVSGCVCAWFWGLCAVAKASVWDVLLLSLGLQKATLGRFPPTPAPFASVLPGGLQTSKAFLAQSFSLLEAIFVLCFSRVP